MSDVRKQGSEIGDQVSRHSPAPWMVSQCSFGRLVQSSDGGQVAVVYFPSVNASSVANESLILLAPELLDLAKLLERAILFQINRDRREGDEEGARLKTITLNLVRDVIAKAEGRS